jgi:hypothetical protein
MRLNPKKKDTEQVSIEILKGGTHLKIVTTSEEDVQKSKNKKVRAFELRDVLSARIDESDPRLMHIWSF